MRSCSGHLNNTSTSVRFKKAPAARWTAQLPMLYSAGPERGLRPFRSDDCQDPCPGSSGVEQRIENPRVGGSNPPPGTMSLPPHFIGVCRRIRCQAWSCPTRRWAGRVRAGPGAPLPGMTRRGPVWRVGADIHKCITGRWERLGTIASTHGLAGVCRHRARRGHRRTAPSDRQACRCRRAWRQARGHG